MKKVLFIGNSHTYFNDMPQMVKELANAAGEELHVTMLTKGGMDFAWHRKQEQTAFNLRYGGYDFCVLQQAAHPFPGQEALSEGAKGICELAGEHPPRFALYMTWAEKAHPENQGEMTEAYRRTAREQALLLAPVGEVWQAFRKEHPDIELYFTDGAHASPAGSLLAAAVIFKTLLQKEPPLHRGEDAQLLRQFSPEIYEAIVGFVQVQKA